MTKPKQAHTSTWPGTGPKNGVHLIRRSLTPPAPFPVQPNNFDLLRLAAALQVVILHSWEHLHLSQEGFAENVRVVLSFFPGVPIFFVISGFLISRSWERSHDGATYARNRFFRIYPALWVAFVVSLALAAGAGAISWKQLESFSFWTWVLAQISVVQFYNPSFLRGFGVGVINGSLWTIPVELAFYGFLPLLYRFGIDRLSRRAADLLLGALALASFLAFAAILTPAGELEGMQAKLLHVSLVPHLFMFLFGVSLQRHLNDLRHVLERKAAAWLVAYLALMVGSRFLAVTDLRALAPLLLLQRALLAVLVVSCAYTQRSWAGRCLRGRDISYGVYLYHMLIVNMLVHFGAVGRWADLVLAVVATLALGVLSWQLIEAPALRHKRKPLRAAA